MTNTNTQHFSKILIATLTILFLTGFSAALDGETINSDEPNIGATAQHTYSFDVQSTDTIATEDLDSLTIDTSNSELPGTISPSDVTVTIAGTAYTGTGDSNSLNLNSANADTLTIDLYDGSTSTIVTMLTLLLLEALEVQIPSLRSATQQKQ